MTTDMEKDDRLLAAEYALGVLNGERLVLAQAKMENEDFRREVDQWHEDFAPLLNECEAIDPPARVWDSIDRKLFGSTEQNVSHFWRRITFWRWATLGSSSVALASIAALLFLPPNGLLLEPSRTNPLVASLSPSGEAPALLVYFRPNDKRLIIRVGTSQSEVNDQRVPELWIIPGDGVPRSLGVLDRAQSNEIAIGTEKLDLIKADAALAISLEPLGGSPTGAPTGPVIASGKLQML